MEDVLRHLHRPIPVTLCARWGVLWGHRHRVPRGLFGSAIHLPGVEPVGSYPIAIIVKNGRITLMGVVDSESDKTVAGMKARGVPGAFGVENELTVEPVK